MEKSILCYEAPHIHEKQYITFYFKKIAVCAVSLEKNIIQACVHLKGCLEINESNKMHVCFYNAKCSSLQMSLSLCNVFPYESRLIQSHSFPMGSNDVPFRK